MGERKVLNKYIPADFDPKLVPRSKKPKDELVSVRMMLPFTIQCSTCSSFMYRGRKFNSKKENVKGSEGKYLGIQRYRFYIKCTACSRPLTFLTDPENADYEMESGGTRTYEVHKDRDRIQQDLEKEDAKTEKEDPMKALENRVLASQREMADMDNLDEIKAMNMRHLKMMAMNGTAKGGVDATQQILNAHHKVEPSTTVQPIELDEKDEEMIRNIKFGQKKKDFAKQMGATKSEVLRLTEKEEEELERQRKLKEELFQRQQMELAAKAASRQTHAITDAPNPLVAVKIKRKRRVSASERIEDDNDATPSDKKVKVQMKKEDTSALGLLSGYGSNSDSD